MEPTLARLRGAGDQRERLTASLLSLPDAPSSISNDIDMVCPFAEFTVIVSDVGVALSTEVISSGPLSS